MGGCLLEEGLGYERPSMLDSHISAAVSTTRLQGPNQISPHHQPSTVVAIGLLPALDGLLGGAQEFGAADAADVALHLGDGHARGAILEIVV